MWLVATLLNSATLTLYTLKSVQMYNYGFVLIAYIKH